MRRTTTALVLAALLTVGVTACQQPPPPNNVAIAQLDGVGQMGSDPVISRTGRYVTYSSPVADIIPGFSGLQLYRYDLANNTIQPVSVSPTGLPAGGGGALNTYSTTSMSSDGRFVAFSSNATNLVAGDTNKDDDVFVRDMDTGVTVRVSQRADGQQVQKGSYRPVISGNGTWVAFQTKAVGLVANDTAVDDGTDDVYRWNRLTNEMTRVTIGRTADGGTTETLKDSSAVSVFNDGRVVLRSYSNNLIAGLLPPEVTSYFTYIANPEAQTMQFLSQTPGGGLSYDAPVRVTPDGRWALYQSGNAGWLPSETLPGYALLVRDLSTGAIVGGPRDLDGNIISATNEVAITSNGRFVAFTTAATNIVPGTSGNKQRGYIWDRTTDTIVRWDRRYDGSETSGIMSGAFGLSDDGKIAIFQTKDLKMFSSAVGSNIVGIAPTRIPD